MDKKKNFVKHNRDVYIICSFLSGLPKQKICSKCFFFIGPMPVNLDRVSLIDLCKKEHIILEKSDGIRYLLFYDKRRLSIIDRKIKSYSIFKNKNLINKKLIFLDGELTFNLILEKYNYLIYDTGIITGDWRISGWDLYSRLRAVENLLQSLCCDLFFKNRFLVEKLFFFKYNIRKNFEAISINSYTKENVFLNVGLKNLFHCNKNDGIIFSPLRVNYALKTTCTTFKWKYEFENTMDLLIQKNVIKKFYKKPLSFPYNLASTINKNKFFKVYKGKKLILLKKRIDSKYCLAKNIGEFRYIQKKGSWVLKKYRYDKTYPNSVRVLCNTLKIISESINKLELVDKVLKFQTRKERGKCGEKYS